MNKKKLALTLLLSSASVSVFADELVKTYTQAEVDAQAATSKLAFEAKVAELTTAQAAVKTANDKLAEVTTSSTATQKEYDAAKASLATANKTLAGLSGDGYFARAWAAVKSNQVATAVLVTTAILVGAVVHAAVSSNNDVENNEDAA